MKRVLSTLLCITLLITVILSGCGKNKSNETSRTNPETTTETQQQEEITKEEEDTTPKYMLQRFDPGIELTQNMQIYANEKYPEGDDLENNAYTRWAKEEYGIGWKAKWIAPDGDADDQKLNLALASNDLPDLIKGKPETIIKIAKAGAIIPLDNYYDEYLSPLSKQVLVEESSNAVNSYFDAVKFEGKIYAVPLPPDGWGTSHNQWIRKDVLDELDLGVPKTLEEFEVALKAYKDKYPNNIGHFVDGNLGGTEEVMNAYGAFRKKWLENESGDLIYGSVQPQMKNALAVLHKWHKNEWIDKEFVIRKPEDNQYFLQGNGLSIHGPWYMITSFINLAQSNADAVIIPLPALTVPDYDRIVTTEFPIGHVYAISKACKNPEAIFQLYNETMESGLRDQKDLQEKYEMKYHYVDLPKEPTNKDEIEEQFWLAKYDFPKEQIGPRCFNVFLPDHGSFGIPFGRSDVLMKGYEHMKDAYRSNNFENLTLGEKTQYETVMQAAGKMVFESLFSQIDVWQQQKSEGIVYIDKFMGVPTPTMLDKKVYLDKLEMETFSNIIMGSQPIDYFDEFVETWMKSGGEQITKEMNENYKLIKGK